VAENGTPSETHEIVCPHCKKTFTASLMDGAAERYRGFKCPHCRLFVPAERAVEPREP
jgi:DNA-directed RNA polymerase subunit RPC12/RpoP